MLRDGRPCRGGAAGDLARALAGLEMAREAMGRLSGAPEEPAPCSDWPAVRADVTHMRWLVGWVYDSLACNTPDEVRRMAATIIG